LCNNYTLGRAFLWFSSGSFCSLGCSTAFASSFFIYGGNALEGVFSLRNCRAACAAFYFPLPILCFLFQVGVFVLMFHPTAALAEYLSSQIFFVHRSQKVIEMKTYDVIGGF
ncbi:MAG: hypothetical protein QXT05_02220, partial [Candidatus Bilamarchaeaceae archaeon]